MQYDIIKALRTGNPSRQQRPIRFSLGAINDQGPRFQQEFRSNINTLHEVPTKYRLKQKILMPKIPTKRNPLKYHCETLNVSDGQRLHTKQKTNLSTIISYKDQVEQPLSKEQKIPFVRYKQNLYIHEYLAKEQISKGNTSVINQNLPLISRWSINSSDNQE